MAEQFDPDAIGADLDEPEFQLNTLFGVDAGVANTPVLLQRDNGYKGLRTGWGGSSQKFTPEVSAPLVGAATRDPKTGKVTGVQGVLNGFYGMDPDSLTNLQQQLYVGGFYSSAYYTKSGKRPQFGVADEDSFAAFKKAAVRAARSGATLSETISTGVDAGQKAAAEEEDPAEPLIIEQTDPATLREVALEYGKKTLGRHPSEAQIQQYINTYRDMQASYQQRAYAMSGSGRPGGTGGTLDEVPAPSDFAVTQFKSQNPLEARTHSALEAATSFYDLLKAPV